MAPPQPLWRQVYDRAERAVTPHLESLVRTGEFARGAALLTQARAAARAGAAGISARLWHLVNLPAGTDVQRLRAQVGALDREVRRLRLHLEQEQRRSSREEEHARPTRPADGARPRPARRRAQRAPDA